MGKAVGPKETKEDEKRGIPGGLVRELKWTPTSPEDVAPLRRGVRLSCTPWGMPRAKPQSTRRREGGWLPVRNPTASTGLNRHLLGLLRSFRQTRFGSRHGKGGGAERNERGRKRGIPGGLVRELKWAPTSPEDVAPLRRCVRPSCTPRGKPRAKPQSTRRREGGWLPVRNPTASTGLNRHLLRSFRQTRFGSRHGKGGGAERNEREAREPERAGGGVGAAVRRTSDSDPCGSSRRLWSWPWM
jgi:hypothetical protein